MGMGNLVKYLRHEISQLSPELSEAESKSQLIQSLNSFLEERVIYARQSIIKDCVSIIKENDVILTFGSSPIIRKILIATAQEKRFQLIVVDTRPLNDGLLTLKALSPYMHCSYTPLSGSNILTLNKREIF